MSDIYSCPIRLQLQLLLHVYTLPSRTGYQIVLVYQRDHVLLVFRGLRPQLQHLHNEASQALVHYLEDENVDFQLAPPSIHRMNTTEKAINTLSNHFIAISIFNFALWVKIIAQSLIKMNLVCRSNTNPNISAYSKLHSAYDFNNNPIVLLYMRFVVHEKTD